MRDYPYDYPERYPYRGHDRTIGVRRGGVWGGGAVEETPYAWSHDAPARCQES